MNPGEPEANVARAGDLIRRVAEPHGLVRLAALGFPAVIACAAPATSSATGSTHAPVAPLPADPDTPREEPCAGYERGLALEEAADEDAQKGALHAYRAACDAECPSACERAGYFLEFGVAETKDPKLAATLYERGCNLGGAHSCAELGFLYEKGEVIPRDLERAAELYRRACDGGDGPGCNDLGSLHRQGLGVPQSHERALELYRRACEHRDSVGCGNVAVMHEKGLAVPPDANAAREYYEKACDLGLEEACARIE